MTLSENKNKRLPAASRQRTVIFSIAVMAAFTLAIYSLVLAFANSREFVPLSTEGMIRTATAADKEKIETGLGPLTGSDLVFVVIDTTNVGRFRQLEAATQGAAGALADSGLAVSVRHVDPEDADFALIAEQNDVDRFPSVLIVKRAGGIVWMPEDISTERLIYAYQAVWGKTSSCDQASSAVY